MKTVLLVFAIYVALPLGAIAGKNKADRSLKVEEHPELGARIIDGDQAVIGQFPWQVLLQILKESRRMICSGALLNNQWILTAAHCLQNCLNVEIYLSGITNGNEETGRMKINASNYFSHENFNVDTSTADIGLVQLESPVLFSERIKPIKLPRTCDRVVPKTSLTVSGWGATFNGGKASNELNYVKVNAISSSECAAKYDNYAFEIVDSHLCAKGVGKKSTCLGDSGGPLVEYENGVPILRGIVSFGPKEGCGLGYPFVFTRTSYFLTWITKYTGIEAETC